MEPTKSFPEQKKMVRSCDCPTAMQCKEFALVNSPLRRSSGFACSVSSLSLCPLRDLPGESRCKPHSPCSASAWNEANYITHLFHCHLGYPAGGNACHFTNLAPLRVTECHRRHPSLYKFTSYHNICHTLSESGWTVTMENQNKPKMHSVTTSFEKHQVSLQQRKR